jgi:hypothetical protein
VQSPLLMFLASLLAFTLGLLVVWVLLVLLFSVPRQAWQRGHGFASWFVMQIIAVNPVYPLVALAMLPDRAKSRLREQYTAELDSRLGTATGTRVRADAAVPSQSVGDLPTLAPPGRSVGDGPTV